MLRLFVAIDIPDEIRESIANIAYGIRGARWVEKSLIHLTLRFIGEIDTDGYEPIVNALGRVQMVPFYLAINGVGHFPPRKNPRILWVGLKTSPPLMDLQHRIEQRLRAAGVAPEPQKFHPHITIARFKEPPPLSEVAPFLAAHSLFASPEFMVSGFSLYSSVLTRDRAVHTREQTFPPSEPGVNPAFDPINPQ